MKRYYVYMLRCRGGALYTGCTDDPARRFCLHCRGKGAKFTKAFPPQELSALWAVDDRSSALSLEARIKALKASQKRLLANNPASLADYFSVPASPVPGTPFPASPDPVPALQEATRSD